MKIEVRQCFTIHGEYNVVLFANSNANDSATNKLFHTNEDGVETFDKEKEKFVRSIRKAFSTREEAEEWREKRIAAATQQYHFIIAVEKKDSDFCKRYEVPVTDQEIS